MTNEEIARFFNTTRPFIQGNPDLRDPQVEGCAQRRRHCSRNQEHEICQGDKCLVIKENMSKNNYCMECAALILQKPREELDGMCVEMNHQ